MESLRALCSIMRRLPSTDQVHDAFGPQVSKLYAQMRTRVQKDAVWRDIVQTGSSSSQPLTREHMSRILDALGIALRAKDAQDIERWTNKQQDHQRPQQQQRRQSPIQRQRRRSPSRSASPPRARQRQRRPIRPRQPPPPPRRSRIRARSPLSPRQRRIHSPSLSPPPPPIRRRRGLQRAPPKRVAGGRLVSPPPPPRRRRQQPVPIRRRQQRSRSRSRSRSGSPLQTRRQQQRSISPDRMSWSRSRSPSRSSRSRSPSRSRSRSRSRSQSRSRSRSRSPSPVNPGIHAGASSVQQHPCIARSEQALQPHQLLAATTAVTRRRFLLHHPPGAGKTLTTIVICEMWLMANPGSFVIVLLPAGLINNFKQGLAKYGRTDLDGIERDYRFYSFESAARPEQFYALQQIARDQILIVDEIHFLRTAVAAAASTTPASDDASDTKKRKPRRKVGAVSDPDAAIAATSDPRACSTGKKAAVFLQLARIARHVLVLTGTLQINGCGDAHTVARILSADEATFLRAFPTSKSMERTPYTPEQEAALHAAFRGNVSYLDPHQLDRSRFPTSREWLVLLEMDPETAAEYSRIERGELKKAKAAGHNVGDLLRPAHDDDGGGHKGKRGGAPRRIDAPGCFYNGLRRAANSMGPLCDSRKRAFILSKARDMRSRRRTMTVASNYREYGIHTSQQELLQEGMRVAEISGEKSTDDRARTVDRCNRSKYDVLLLTTGAGGTGLDLKGIDTHINMESAWNWATRQQANARCVRFGSHEHLPIHMRHVEIYNLFMVKPREFQKYVEKMSLDCKARRPGSGDGVLPIPWVSSSSSSSSSTPAAAAAAPPDGSAAAAAADTDAEHDKLPAIDLFLYERVVAKASKIQDFCTRYLLPNSIEVLGPQPTPSSSAA